MAPDSLSYLERAADRDLIDALAEGRYVFILDSRQKGKSSVVGHALSILQMRGTRVVRVDLQRVGANLDVEKWYAGILNVIGRDLGVANDLFALWKDRLDLGAHARFMEVLELGILDRVEDDIVILIDEIDFVRSLPFQTDEFFAGIRDCHNRRAAEPKYRRLTFCLVGVASAAQLIDNPETTPFNVGDRVNLHDFSRWELRPYESPLSRYGRDGKSLIDRVHHWVNGHPYLTQLLCRWIAEDETIRSVRDVDHLVERELLSAEARQREPNLADVERRLLKPYVPGLDPTESQAVVIDAYRRVIGKGLPSQEVGDEIATVLKLSGAVAEQKGRLVARNRLYRTLFGPAFVENAIPRGEAERIRLATKRAQRRTFLLAFCALVGVGLIAGIFAILAHDRYVALSESRRIARHAADEAYRTSMLLASREALDGSWPTVGELVESQAAYPDRGWEWRYWNRLLTRGTLVLPSIPGPSFTHVWVENGHIYRMRSGSYFRDGEGPFPLSRSSVGTSDANFLEMTIGQGKIEDRLARFDRLASAGGPIIFLFADGRTSIRRNGRGDREIQILDSKGVRTYRSADSIRYAWSDGSEIYLATQVSLVKIRVRDLAVAWAIATSPGYAFTVDNTLGVVVTADQHFGIDARDAKTGKLLTKSTGLASTPLHLRVFPTIDRATVGYQNGAVLVLDTRTWQPVTQLTGHTSTVVWPWLDGDRLLTMDDSGEVRSWPVGTLRENPLTALNAGEIESLVVSPAGDRLAASTMTGKVFLADAKTLGTIRVFEAERPQNHHDIAFSTDGARLLFVTQSGTLRVVDPSTGRSLQTFRRYPYFSARFVPGSAKLAATTRDGKLIRIDGPGHEDEIPLDFEAQFLAFSKAGTLAVQGRRSEVVLFDRGYRPLRSLPKPSDEGVASNLAIRSIKWSPDGSRVAFPTLFKTVRVVGLDERDDRTLGPFPSRLWEARFSPDGSLLLVNGFDLRPSLWDVNSGEKVASFLNGGWVAGTCFSPDGSRVATASEDGTVRVWDLKGHELARLTKTPRPMFDVGFSPDGSRLFAAGTDGILRVFDAGN